MSNNKENNDQETSEMQFRKIALKTNVLAFPNGSKAKAKPRRRTLGQPHPQKNFAHWKRKLTDIEPWRIIANRLPRDGRTETLKETKKFEGNHDRFLKDSTYRDSQIKIGWTEEPCIAMDKFTQEDHSHCTSSEDNERCKKNWYLCWTNQGRNAPIETPIRLPRGTYKYAPSPSWIWGRANWTSLRPLYSALSTVSFIFLFSLLFFIFIFILPCGVGSMRSPMRASANEELGTLAENNPLLFTGDVLPEKGAVKRRLCELHRLLKSRKGPSTPLTEYCGQRQGLWLQRKVRTKHWTLRRRNRVDFEVTMASVTHELQAGNITAWSDSGSGRSFGTNLEKRKSVYRTIQTTRATCWPRQPMTCLIAGRLHIKPRALRKAQGHGEKRGHGDPQGTNQMYYERTRQGWKPRQWRNWLLVWSFASRLHELAHSLTCCVLDRESNETKYLRDGSHWGVANSTSKLTTNDRPLPLDHGELILVEKLVSWYGGPEYVLCTMRVLAHDRMFIIYSLIQWREVTFKWWSSSLCLVVILCIDTGWGAPDR